MNQRRLATLSQDEQMQNLILGTIAGSILGAGTALLFAPKSGRELRHDMYTAYNDLSEKATELKDDLIHQGEELFESSNGHSIPNSGMIAGGLAGGLLGIAVVALLAQRRNQSFGDTISEKTRGFAEGFKKSSHFVSGNLKAKAGCWVRNAKNILSTLDDALEEGTEKVEHAASNKIDDILELANVGMRLFQNFKQRR